MPSAFWHPSSLRHINWEPSLARRTGNRASSGEKLIGRSKTTAGGGIEDGKRTMHSSPCLGAPTSRGRMCNSFVHSRRRFPLFYDRFEAAQRDRASPKGPFPAIHCLHMTKPCVSVTSTICLRDYHYFHFVFDPASSRGCWCCPLCSIQSCDFFFRQPVYALIYGFVAFFFRDDFVLYAVSFSILRMKWSRTRSSIQRLLFPSFYRLKKKRALIVPPCSQCPVHSVVVRIQS